MSKQTSLDIPSKSTSPVECLGQSFASDEARREHYLKLLAEKLKDPEFRKIEGFPIGEDVDILALSDPPYYTACPNPWIGDFLKHYGRPYDPKEKYHREPFAADVSEGKNHPIYQAHSYHTKVPHRAIMRYILHYTQPGEFVFDGFSGTGMTGVAARLCGDRSEVQSLGYKIDHDGNIFNAEGSAFSKLGPRIAALTDLSPIGSFIAFNYNDRIDTQIILKSYQKSLADTDAELGWMYSVLENATPDASQQAAAALRKCSTLEECSNLLSSPDALKKAIALKDINFSLGRLNYTVWSEIFACPECSGEVNFWKVAVSPKDWQVMDAFLCPHCHAHLNKSQLNRTFSSVADPITNLISRLAKSMPALVYGICGKKRFYREPDEFDLELVATIQRLLPHSAAKPIPLPSGDKMSDPKAIGIGFFHQFYTPRNLLFMSTFKSKLGSTRLLGPLTSSALVLSKMYRFRSQNGSLGAGGGPMNGTLYVPSLIKEIPASKTLKEHVEKSVNMRAGPRETYALIQTSSFTNCPQVPSNSLDYLFLDPPFGANLMYSELNFIWECWLLVKTHTEHEAIENRTQLKTNKEYRYLMMRCFSEAFRILKPGRWMTVEFSNTRAEVWNSIQSALQESGFVVANVSALNKKQGSFNAVTNSTSVKQDLVISAYKPDGGLEDRFQKSAHTTEGIWNFIHTHLRNLPVIKPRGGEMEFISERDPRILYDRMVAFYVGHGVPVPLSSAEFQAALAEKFPEREGMFFLPDQVDIWDKKRAQMQGVGQMSIFVDDEKSAIDWLRSFLKNRPSITSDITSEFMQQLGASWKKFETRPELRVLLEQNFLKYDGTGEVPNQIHSYLSTQFKDLRNLAKDDSHLQSRAKDRWYVPDPGKAVDVEAVRNKRLLAEFWDLCAQAGINRPASEQSDQGRLPFPAAAPAKKGARKKLKEVRTEAVRLGFKECFAAKNYATILTLSEHLPANVIEEDEQLQMIHDMAEMRAEG